ncbi:MAG: hypothetical protein ACQESQ_07945 [Bacteroidota bacterium]
MKVKIIGSFFILMIFFAACDEKKKTHVAKFEGKSSAHAWAIDELNTDFPSDWSSFDFLTFELKASSTQRFFLKIHDAEGIRQVRIHPFQNAWVRASIPLIHFQKRNTKGHDMAAIGKTALPGLWIGFTSSVGSIQQVDSIGVEMNRPIDSPSLEIRNVHLTMDQRDSILSPLPTVDQFGQWIPDDWEGKANSLNELKTIWAKEDKNLRSEGFNVSKYGGYLDTKAEATGFFRVEKIDGKWWFVDPEGHLFFSAGSTGIHTGGSFARVQGREYVYEAFPPESLIQSDSRIEKASFYSWNLYRRYGDNWYEKWKEMTFRRMDSWGLNTIANWSDENLGQSQQKTYVATLRGWGFSAETMGMPDVYDPNYAAEIDSAAKRQCLPLKDDPYLLGYFVGNEPPWPGREMDLINVILEGDDTPMKSALKKYLDEGDTPERRKSFVYDTYKKFITTVNSAIKKYDPNHLNLGLRFGGNPPDEIIKASSDIGFDVFSLNIYGYTTYKDRLERIDHFTGLPIIIGEFHFGTPGRGLAPGLAQTSSQEERGVAYRYYVENAAAHPSVIGTHWFQWWDQPSTGRYDGENYNIGFVNVTDVPYKELVEAAKVTHHRIKDIHLGNVKPTTRETKVQ